MMVKPELYSQVALTHDLPNYRLKAGDVVTLVDDMPHPAEGEEGCILEVFNAFGETIAIVTLKLSEIEALKADEVLTVRSLS
jgi:hypothetical protein